MTDQIEALDELVGDALRFDCTISNRLVTTQCYNTAYAAHF